MNHISITAEYLRRLTLLCLGLATLLSIAESAQGQDKPGVQATITSGERIDLPGSISFVDNRVTAERTSRPFTDFVRIDFPQRVRPASTLVFLSNGDQLALTIERIEDEALSATYRGQTINIPLEFVAAIAFHLPETNSARRARMRLVESPRTDDTVSLKNGDSVTGEIQSMTPESLTIDGSSGHRTLPRERIRMVHFSSDLQSPVPKTGRNAIVQTTDGCILTTTRLRSAGDALTLTTTWDRSLQVSHQQLHSVQFLHKSISYLSDLTPDSAKHAPYIGDEKQWNANRNVNGGQLTHDDRRYVRGIGTTSRSELTWRLSGNHRAFHTAFGLDDTAANGAAVFRILTDGKEVFRREVTRSHVLLHAPPIDLAGAKKLTLVVDYGRRGDMQDFANWIDPMLVQQSKRD